MSIRDPVTGFLYPDEWITRCDPKDIPGVISGLGVLTSSGKVLRRGYSTGTTAAAACKAAICSLVRDVDSVPITIPCGIVLEVPVRGRRGTAISTKFAGDYPDDATAGLEFRAVATRITGRGISLVPGEGIGRFSRDTPRFRTGDPAISPAALQSIHDAMAAAASGTGLEGVSVRLSVPRGEAVASGTLNPRVGVQGGISILGTTGLVEPWDDHLGESVIERVAGARRVVLTTGRTGLRYSRLLFPGHDVVLVGARIGQALEQAKGEVILCGLPGLILKYLEPGILDGSGCNTIEELSVSPEFPARAARAIDRFSRSMPHVRVVLLDREGRIIGGSR